MKKEGLEKQNLKSKILDLLSRREYSRTEIEQKIIIWLKRQHYLQTMARECEDGKSQFGQNRLDELQGILDEFESKGWLSDERYVESLINQKAYRLGGVRLKQELKNKGVHEELVQASIEQLKDSEYQRAYDVWVRKFKALPTDSKNYQKQMRFLLYRGFATEIIKKILSGANV